MAAFFFDYCCRLNGDGYIVFLIGFNSNSNSFHTDRNRLPGYDLPFLITRSQLDLHPETKIMKMTLDSENKLQQLGSSIISFKKLPFIYCIDYQQVLSQEMM